ATWYQGESNAGRPTQYRTLLPTMIEDWRNRFNVGKFPFLVVQLANFMDVDVEPVESNWAALREAQSLTAERDPRTGLAVTIDIGDAKDIHPRNKQDVGKRLALEALRIGHGQDILSRGPQYKGMEIKGKEVRVHFSNAGEGLSTMGTGRLQGFTLAGADGKFHWANARIDGSQVVVSSSKVPAPAAVRYAWANNPVCNLYNSACLPAVPFRSDQSGVKVPTGFTSLFDGQTLKGWVQRNGTAKFDVIDGTIVGTTSKGSPNSFLCTKENYGDFELQFEVNLINNELNSGVQIRSNSKKDYKDYRVHGYQCEIATNGTAGYIYDEGRRGWLSQNRKDKKQFKNEGWNHYRILCRDDLIKTWVNGIPMAHVKDSMTPSGFIGLQVHGVGGDPNWKVAWRNIWIRKIEGSTAAVGKATPKKKTASVAKKATGGDKQADKTRTGGTPKKNRAGTAIFNGKDLKGWSAKKGGWVVEQGSLARRPKGGYIWSEKTYEDFVLDVDFKIAPQCNSGIFIRSNPKSPVQEGFEIQVFDSHGRSKIGRHDCGALYDAVAPKMNASKPAGEWNHARIRAKGSKITVHLNGKKVVAADLAEWKEARKNPDGSKNKFKKPLKEFARMGHIGFQDHGHDVWYKNITIRELK
ncbi:MAG: family 16 glycoside hydrolase, partial [Verrucomicrobiota bacterium]